MPYLQIQSLKHTKEEVVILTNNSPQLVTFLNHFDKFFSHGLKSSSKGYWRFVRNITDKVTLSEILESKDVKSDLRRGRFWLYRALSCGAMESYLLTIVANDQLVKKHYKLESLLLDNDMLNIMITLTSGLEHVCIQLDLSIDHLDIKRFPKSTMDLTQSNRDDQISIGGSPIKSRARRPVHRRVLQSERGDDAESIHVTAVSKRRQPTRVRRRRPAGDTHDNAVTSLSCEAFARRYSLGGSGCESLTASGEHRHPLPLGGGLKFEVGSLESADSSSRGATRDSGIGIEGANGRGSAPVTPPAPSPLPAHLLDAVALKQALLAVEVADGIARNNASSSSSSPNSTLSDYLNTTPADVSIYDASRLDLDSISTVWVDSFNAADLDDDSSINEATVAPPPSVQRRDQIVFHEREIKLDQNEILQVSLDVLKYDTEKPVKMFNTYTGHNLGEQARVMFLLSDRCAYIVKLLQTSRVKYHTDLCINLCDVDFVSLSFNDQTVTIASKVNNAKIALTTGCASLSRYIVNSLRQEMRLTEYGPTLNPTLNPIVTDSTLERVSICKAIAAELVTKPEQLNIANVTLTHWKDSRHTDLDINDTQQGYLKVKCSATLIYNETWTLAYFILSGNLLKQFNNDKMTQLTRNYQLGEGDCIGCRRTTHNHHKHTFEVLMKDGSSIELMTSSTDLQIQWITHICAINSVQQQTYSTIACCVAMVTLKDSFSLVTYQENSSHNGFVRVLGTCPLVDLQMIFTDERYCLLIFDDNKFFWLFYFNSISERHYFTDNISDLWKLYFKEELTIKEFDDAELHDKCRDHEKKLLSSNRI